MLATIEALALQRSTVSRSKAKARAAGRRTDYVDDIIDNYASIHIHRNREIRFGGKDKANIDRTTDAIVRVTMSRKKDVAL